MPSYRLNTDIPWTQTRGELAECMRKWRVRDYEVLAELTYAAAKRAVQTEEQREVILLVTMRDGVEIKIASKAQARALDNFRVVYLAADAMRLNDARGITDTLREAYLQLPAPVKVRDPYEVLGIRPDAPDELVDASYRALAKKAHPDAGGSDEAMAELNDAYERVKEERGL